MIVAVAALLSAGFGSVLWVGMRPVFERPAFLRENVRGRAVPTAAGLLLPVAATFGLAAISVVDSLGVEVDADGVRAAQLTLATALGFSLLGLLDDLAVDQGVSGYRGHVRALLRGRLSAGALKLVGGGALALVAVAPVAGESAVRLALDGALVALGANLANLLDRAPGRVGKVGLAAAVALVAATAASAATTGVALVGGATLALLLPDLRERLMLGDAGSNALGASLGLGVVLSCGTTARAVVLAVVAALNLVSERVSFSAVIRRTAPLRYLDELGRAEGTGGPAPGAAADDV